ncbi:GIY-YIG nuclease family protein [Lysinimonas soli]|uniref:GIY-YIG nuclease family protein n=1 Tax=Lysinimonas soli TaxID=1074233 RepID=A0ABW0NPX3_9MICO
MQITSDGAARRGVVTLAHLLDAAAVENLADVVIVRHTFGPKGLSSPSSLADPNYVLAYTREQGFGSGHKLGIDPPGTWLIFTADSGRRARFYTAYENRGEVAAERTDLRRFFDLHETDLLETLRGRLVIEWGNDPVNWAKSGATASQYRVVEIADPESVPFPGYDRLLIDYDTLRAVSEDSRYAKWRTALESVKGIYLIADSTGPGRLYVGQASGEDGVLGRWNEYARNGHGGNVALGDGTIFDPRTAHYSLLRVFGPATPLAEILEAEEHYKLALLSRKHGLNRN